MHAVPFGPHDVLKKSCLDQILDWEKVLFIAFAADMSENGLRLHQNDFKMLHITNFTA